MNGELPASLAIVLDVIDLLEKLQIRYHLGGDSAPRALGPIDVGGGNLGERTWERGASMSVNRSERRGFVAQASRLQIWPRSIERLQAGGLRYKGLMLHRMQPRRLLHKGTQGGWKGTFDLRLSTLDRLSGGSTIQHLHP